MTAATESSIRDVVARLRRLSPVELLGDGSMTVEQVVQEFNVGRTTCYAWMSKYGVPFTQSSGRRLLPRRAVLEVLAAGLVGVERQAELQSA